MIKRIIFDIDGTLITGVNFTQYVEKALIKYGINDPNKLKLFLLNIREYEQKYSSYNRDLYLKFFSDRLSCQLNCNFLQLFFEELKKAIPSNSEKIFQMLSNLKDYELVLLSNYFEESQRNRLCAMGINDFFIEYYGEKIIKPNEEVYINAAGPYKPRECIIVGDDKLLDIDIPYYLGFNTIYVNEKGDIKNVEDITLKLIKLKESRNI